MEQNSQYQMTKPNLFHFTRALSPHYLTTLIPIQKIDLYLRPTSEILERIKYHATGLWQFDQWRKILIMALEANIFLPTTDQIAPYVIFT
jgi:hypothetical protein